MCYNIDTTTSLDLHNSGFTVEIQSEIGQDKFIHGKFHEACSLFLEMIKKEKFDDFLTLPAYDQL